MEFTSESLRAWAVSMLSEITDKAATDGARIRRIEWTPETVVVLLTTDPEETVDELNTAGAET